MTGKLGWYRFSMKTRAALVACLVLIAGCGEGSPISINIEIDQDLLKDKVSTWVQDFGTEQTDPDVWAERLDRACGEGVWDLSVARDLAVEFVTEDLRDAAAGEGLDPTDTEDAAAALQEMAKDACPEKFGDD
mgnify:FL=1